MNRTVIALACLAMFSHIAQAAPSHPPIFPTPFHVEWGKGSFVLNASDNIFPDDLAPSGRIKFRLLKDRSDWMGDEGYWIAVTPQQVDVSANTPTGLFYGSITLQQLVQKDGNRSFIPMVTIEDKPEMAYRGVMVDISRGLVPTPATFERIIRALAQMKINAVQPYIEDTYAFDAYPYIGRDRGAWTPAEVREIAQVAQQCHVDMSPCFESLGHMWQILRHPELSSLRETAGVISPVNEGTYNFLGTCYGEFASTFPFPYINVGCDETQELGKGPSKASADKIGVGKVYSNHLCKLDDLCHKFNRKMQFWGDMALSYPGVIADLPRDAVAMNWEYSRQKDFKSIGVFKANGFQQIVCPGLWSWGTMFPNSKLAEGNIRGFIKEGKAAGVLGVLNTAWRDNGEVFYDYDWYGEAIGAECAWADQPVEGADFDAAFERGFFGPHSAGMAKAYRDLADCLSLPGFGAEGTLQLYYSDPFKDLSPMENPRCVASLNRLSALAHQIRQVAHEPCLHAESLPYLLLAADRIDYIAAKYQSAWRVANLYAQGSRENLLMASADVDALIADTRNLKDRYSKLWLMENKPEGLNSVMARYQPILTNLSALRARLAKAIASLDAGAPLPSADDMGIALPKSTPSGYRIPSPIVTTPAWAPAGALAIQIHLGDALTQTMPIRLIVKSAVLPVGIGPVARLRQMDGQGKATQTLACQIDRQDSKQSILTFLLPAGSGGDLNLALDSSSVATPDALNVSPATELKDGLWIAGSRYRALLGPQGAHLYRWDVNALAGQDITMSGDVDWEGFDDVGGQRSTAFTLKAVASGPICVQIDCRSTDGLGKTLTFYAGLGWYDTRFDDPVNFFWQYDDPAVMGPTSKTPGTFRFSDGRTGSLPPDGVISYAERSSWVARFRPDGLTLGLISPESVATLRAGPGGSMGGVGVEGNEAVRHLLTYADIAPNNWTTVSDLFENALRLNKACVNMR